MIRFFSALSILCASLFLLNCGCAQAQVIDKPDAAQFSIPPKIDNTYYLQFMAVGDVGTGGDGQKKIASYMAEYAQKDPISLVLMLGDNFYGVGVSSAQDPQWKSKFHEMYNNPALAVPFYASLGNHDHYSNADAQIIHAQCCSQDQWQMPARYYSFKRQLKDGVEVEFFALDTYPIHKERDESKMQLNWLKDALKKSTARWKIVYGHHPLYSNGMHGNNPNMIKALTPLLKEYKVDLFIAGHDHDQQLLKPVNGTLHMVSGAGAIARNVYWKRNTIYADTNLGFTTFRLSENDLLISFINGKGQIDFAHNIHKDSLPNHSEANIDSSLSKEHEATKPPAPPK